MHFIASHSATISMKLPTHISRNKKLVSLNLNASRLLISSVVQSVSKVLLYIKEFISRVTRIVIFTVQYSSYSSRCNSSNSLLAGLFLINLKTTTAVSDL